LKAPQAAANRERVKVLWIPQSRSQLQRTGGSERAWGRGLVTNRLFVQRVFDTRVFRPFIDHAMLMSPSKGETAVHVCHCPSDVTVRMREVLARPWVGVCVPLALS